MGAAKRRAVTREDVARLAQVSTAVVSYVINDGPRPVAEETRARVRWAIDQLGFRPNARARALSLGASFTYGVMVPNVQNMFHAAIVQALEDALAARDLSMLLAHARGAGRMEEQTLNDMIGRGVDGVISLMTYTSEIEWMERNLSVPAVLMDRQSPLKGLVTICPDFEEGGFIATEHLIGHGARTIVPIFGPMHAGERNSRLIGYQRAMEAAGLPEQKAIITAWSMRGGFEAAQVLLDQGQLPDAVFCFSDMMAVGFLSALSLRGLHAPDDIAVICFDGTDAARYSSPPLSSVTQPVQAMAEAAVAGVLRPKSTDIDHQVFPVSLTVRQSCGCQ